MDENKDQEINKEVEKVDFDSMFEESDIETWGFNVGDDVRLSAASMHHK